MADRDGNVWTNRAGERLDTPDQLAAHLADLADLDNDPDRLAELRAEVDEIAAQRAAIRRTD